MTAITPTTPNTDEALAHFEEYLVEEKHRIRLYRLVHEQTDAVCARLSEDQFPIGAPELSQDVVTYEYVRQRITDYEEVVRPLTAILACGCFFGEESQNYLWATSLRRVANEYAVRSGHTYTLLGDLRRYPAVLMLYAGGIAAIAQKHYRALANLFLVRVRDRNDEQPAVATLYPLNVIESNHAGPVFGNRQFFSLSEHLYGVLREELRPWLPEDAEYQRCFDVMEYLLGLVHMDLQMQQERRAWGPVGGFCFRYGRFGTGNDKRSPLTWLEAEASSKGDQWQLLTSGLFNGSLEHFREVKAIYDEFVQRVAVNGW